MLSPIGKLLVEAGLPKDVAQFIVQPMMTISEAEVRSNHKRLLVHFKNMAPVIIYRPHQGPVRGLKLVRFHDRRDRLRTWNFFLKDLGVA